MTNQIQIGLRENAAEPPKNEDGDIGDDPGGLWYRVEREIVPLLRRMREVLASVGPGFGTTVTISDTASPYTVEAGVEIIRVDAAAGPVVVNIPAGQGNAIRFLSIKKLDVTSNAVDVTAVAGEDIDGGPVASMTGPQSFIRLIPRDSGYDVA